MSPAPPAPAAHGRIAVSAAADAPRLDRMLADALPGFSRARVQALIAQGCVTLEGVIVRDASARVVADAEFVLEVPAPVAATPQAQNIALDILYEDEALIVLDKPAGLVVHPAPGSPDATLVNALLFHCGDTFAGIGGERRPGIVHRLDKDTSGVMVVAKTAVAMARLAAAFAARDLDRAYLAICWGCLVPPSGQIEGAIGRDPRDRKRMAVVRSGGKSALTHYAVQRSWRGAASLLECRLATGRTHQIRVHLAARGSPLVGDPTYLRRVPASAGLLGPGLRATLLDFPRQALHAARLGFAHPVTGVPMQFVTAPPGDFAALLGALDATNA